MMQQRLISPLSGKFIKLAVAAAVGMSLLAQASMSSARDKFRLRVDDAIAAPGGLTALVVRTYASRSPAGRSRASSNASWTRSQKASPWSAVIRARS